MNKIDNRQKKGFTLAELMLVIAITGILAAFGFIAVTRYMRILEHMKYDAIAKEIFISAQNHLSMANNEGYLDTDKNKLGTKEGKRAGFEDITDEDSGVYYYVVNGKNDVDQANSLISIMLPFGAIDETVRTEGSYIIRYNKETAQVMDVFYSEKTNTRYGHEFSDLYTESSDTSSGSSSQSLMNLRDEDDKNIRRYYKKETNGSTSVIGYYGGTEGNPLYGDKIPLPFIRVDNAEELKVTIKTSGLSPTATLQLFIEGELSTDGEGTSRNKKMLVLKKSNEIDKREYEIVLDSITQKIIDSSNEANSINHFNNLFGDDGVIPGENLIIYAVASDKSRNIKRFGRCIECDSTFSCVL